jgi:molybdopterin converting factor subunit 1
MKVKILFFGITTDLVGENSILFTVKNGSSIKEIKEALLLNYTGLKNINEFAIAVNETYANDDLIINEGDVIAIIPPVSGG